MLRKIVRRPYRFIINTLLRIAYGKYITEQPDELTLLKFAFFQKVLGINRSIPWPVHFTSIVLLWKNINLGKNVTPGSSSGCYIQAANGITFGANVWIGPNVVIVSANHDVDDYQKHVKSIPIEIGNNVWISANSVILPGVKIGSNVIIGAGSVVNHDIPDNCIAVGNPCVVTREKAPYKGKIYS